MGHERFNRAGALVEDETRHPVPVKPQASGLLVNGLWGAGEVALEEAAPEHSDGSPAETPSPRGDRRGHSRSRGDRRQVLSTTPFRGRYIRPIPAAGRWNDLAWAATFRAAARSRRPATGDLLLQATVDDLQRKQRVCPAGRLLLFVVDVSGSMGGRLSALAKQMALALLRDAYIKRDRVAMIAFRERSAELLFGPTNQVALVERGFDRLPCGGTTPLAMGLELAQVVLRRTLAHDAGLEPTLILVSDGRANVGSQPGYAAVLGEVEAATRALASMSDLSIVFLDTTEEGKNDNPARNLSELLAARRVALWRLVAEGRDPATVLTQLL